MAHLVLVSGGEPGLRLPLDRHKMAAGLQPNFGRAPPTLPKCRTNLAESGWPGFGVTGAASAAR